MMRYLNYLFLCLSLFFITSCGVENLYSDNANESAITFNTSMQTRATQLSSIPDFKVYAYDASGNAIISGKVFTADGNCKDGTVFYWPKSGNVTFYAYAPANDNSVVWNSNKTLTYSAPVSEANQQDVIYAYTAMPRPLDGRVPLAFKHANAALNVKWSRAGDLPSTTTVNVSNVKVCNVKQSGTLSFTSGMTASGNNISTDLGQSGLMMVAPQTTNPWSSGAFTSSSNCYLAINCKVSLSGNYLVGSASADGTIYYPLSQSLAAATVTTVWIQRR